MSVLVHWLVHESTDIAWNFDVLLYQCENPMAAELSNEKTQLKNHILPRTRHLLATSFSSDIIGSQQNDSETWSCVRFKFLNDRLTFVCLFIQNYGLKAKPFDRPRHSFSSCFVMSVNNEDATAVQACWRNLCLGRLVVLR